MSNSHPQQTTIAAPTSDINIDDIMFTDSMTLPDETPALMTIPEKNIKPTAEGEAKDKADQESCLKPFMAAITKGSSTVIHAVSAALCPTSAPPTPKTETKKRSRASSSSKTPADPTTISPTPPNTPRGSRKKAKTETTAEVMAIVSSSAPIIIADRPPTPPPTPEMADLGPPTQLELLQAAEAIKQHDKSDAGSGSGSGSVSLPTSWCHACRNPMRLCGCQTNFKDVPMMQVADQKVEFAINEYCEELELYQKILKQRLQRLQREVRGAYSSGAAEIVTQRSVSMNREIKPF